MKVIEKDSHEMASRAAADLVRELIHEQPKALVCFSSGSSPLRMYELLARGPLIAQHSIRALAVDEWHGLDQRHPSTCRYCLEHHVLNPWGIPEEHRYLFNAAAPDPEAECARMAAVLATQGPVDLCILGLGRNGHLGLNEPGPVLRPHAHVAVLEPGTRQHPMLVAEGISVSTGMTFGMADLLGSRRIILLVTGRGKADAARTLLEGGVTTHLPASFLHLHPDTTVVLDTSVFDSNP